MRISKKILALLLALLMLVGVVSVTASAEEENIPDAVLVETEENNSAATANALELEKEISGALGGAEDVDWFKVTVAQAGVLSVKFTHGVFESTLSYYVVDVVGIDGENEVVLSSATSLGENAEITTAGASVAAGTYYVRVQSGNVVSEDGYALTVSLSEARNSETEPNNAFADADAINAATVYYGAISAADDVDWYLFNLAAKGYADITISDDTAASGNAEYKVSVMKLASGAASEPETIATFATDSSKADTKFPRVGLDAGSYYLKIENNSSDVTNSAYSFSVKTNAYEFYETEPNDNWKTADAFDATVNTGDSYTGTRTNNIYANLATADDVDWFAVSHNAAGISSMELIIRVDAGVNADSWKVELYNSDLLIQSADASDISAHTVSFDRTVKTVGEDTDIVCKVNTSSYKSNKLVAKVYCDGDEVDTSMYSVICVVSVDNTPAKSDVDNIKDYFEGLSAIEWPFLTELFGKIFEGFTADTFIGLIGNIGSQLVNFLYNFLG